MNTETTTGESEQPIRVLLAKPTHDVHDRGVRLVARRFRDYGFEVVFTNFLLAHEIVDTAIEEDVDVIGVSISAGGQIPIFEDLFAGLKEHDLEDITVIGGGVIPYDDEETLKAMGVKAIFGPGTSAEEARDMIERELNNEAEA
ncbi:MAG: cobalamin-dependent protein [Alphaproteobacteria bacterium]|jgi:methylmalonyl-CoA mutase C-terminal domain/subunit|nr:cobalamin-dependent protein [Alphaproteobacteria bacterium]